jgi:hypothetical protein
MRRASAIVLMFHFLAPGALAQTAPAGEPATQDAALQAARAKTCAAFLGEASRHAAAGGEPGQTPSFALIWSALLRADPASGQYMGKSGLGRIMYQNTTNSCQRMRERTLGATMDTEYAAL